MGFAPFFAYKKIISFKLVFSRKKIGTNYKGRINHLFFKSKLSGGTTMKTAQFTKSLPLTDPPAKDEVAKTGAVHLVWPD